jgi:hypothetical protein
MPLYNFPYTLTRSEVIRSDVLYLKTQQISRTVLKSWLKVGKRRICSRSIKIDLIIFLSELKRRYLPDPKRKAFCRDFQSRSSKECCC